MITKLSSRRAAMLAGLGCWLLAACAYANGHNLTYYGVENDPDKSESANRSAAAAKEAGSANDASRGKIPPVRQSRTGQQILSDLDSLVADHGENGKLKPGVFIFHYSGHGNATVGGPAVIGEPAAEGQPSKDITTDALVDKLLQITTENNKVLLLLDSCGAGNLKRSLDAKVKDEDGKRMSYYAVMGTKEFTAADEGLCPRQGHVDIGSKMKDGLASAADGKARADKNKDGQVSVKELGDHIFEEGDGFSSSFLPFEDANGNSMLDMPVTGTELVNGVAPTKQPSKDERVPAAESGTGDSLHYDADSQIISFTDHVIIGTGFGADPLTGAELVIPSMSLLGQVAPQHYLFAASDPVFTVASAGGPVLSAALPQLLYDAGSNALIGELFAPVLQVAGSPWLGEVENIVSPGSAAFDPEVSLFFRFNPAVHLLALTQDFAVAGSATGSDFILVAAPVPAPQAVWLSLFGVLLAGCAAVNRHARRPPPRRTSSSARRSFA